MPGREATAEVDRMLSVGCGRSLAKNELLRLVRGPDGLEPDPSGRLPGRGAYLCRTPECAAQAATRGGFQRSFRGPVAAGAETLDFIEKWQRDASTK